MTKQAGGRPAKSGARRELKTFRLVPDAIARLERMAAERGGSTSDVLNDVLMDEHAAARAPRRLELVSPGLECAGGPNVARFRLLPGKAKAGAAEASHLANRLERLRDGMAGALVEIEGLMAEQLEGPAHDGYAAGFRDGMLEALETAYSLLQAELLQSED